MVVPNFTLWGPYDVRAGLPRMKAVNSDETKLQTSEASSTHMLGLFCVSLLLLPGPIHAPREGFIRIHLARNGFAELFRPRCDNVDANALEFLLGFR
jgi:hypothetical protein